MTEEPDGAEVESTETGVGKRSILARAVSSFNEQGGLNKIIIGAATTALAALLVATPGVVSAWIDGSDDDSGSDPSTTTNAPQSTVVEITATSVDGPSTTTNPPASPAPPTPIRIDDVLPIAAMDPGLLIVSMVVEGGADSASLRVLEIATRMTGGACVLEAQIATGQPVPTQTSPNIRISPNATVEDRSDDGTTFILAGQEQGSPGYVRVEGSEASDCGIGDTSRLALWPQLPIYAAQLETVEVQIPRTIETEAETATEFFKTLQDAVDRQLPSRELFPDAEAILAVRVRTTDECASYHTDLYKLYELDEAPLIPDPLQPLLSC